MEKKNVQLVKFKLFHFVIGYLFNLNRLSYMNVNSRHFN